MFIDVQEERRFGSWHMSEGGWWVLLIKNNHLKVLVSGYMLQSNQSKKVYKQTFTSELS